MIGCFPVRASRTLVGACALAAALMLPAASASAQGITAFSAQGRVEGGPPRVRGGGVPYMKGPSPGAGPRGPVGGAPRVMGGPPRSYGVAPRIGGPGPRYGGPGGPGFRGPAVGFRGPVYGGRAAFIRGRHHVRRGGLLLPLIGLGALGAIYVGSRPYTPYAYVDGPVGPQCAGPTEDGVCELRMTEVPLEDGGAELQCVAYCPQ
jgi:hypothetical protein